MSEKKNIATAAGVLGSATIVSRIMGMLRDMAVSRFFGAGMATDAFFAAFQIPNMLRRFFAEGALTSAFVPLFSATVNRDGDEKAKELANACFTLLTMIMAMVTLCGIIFSPLIVGIMFPGFKSVPGKFELTVTLNRLMFPYIFFISLVALCMGILNTLRHFFTPAISTVFLNISIILSAFFMRDLFYAPVTALAAGVFIGGSLQLIMQLPVLARKGYFPRPSFNFRIPEIRNMALLIFPSIFGVGVYYLNIGIGAILASLLPQGSVSYLYYAQRLFEFPQGIFTVSVAQAVLPSMSRQAAEGEIDAMKESLSFGLRLTLFITIPAMAGLMIVATPVFSLLFMGGKFDYSGTLNSSEALFYYSAGLSFVAVTRVLAPAFYALKDTRTPVYCAFAAFIINLLFSLLLMGGMKHSGLALATTVSACGNMLLLLLCLERKIGSFGGKEILAGGVKSLLASIPMAIVVYCLCTLADWSLGEARLFKSLLLFFAVVSGASVYLLLSYLFGSPEAVSIIGLMRKKLTAALRCF